MTSPVGLHRVLEPAGVLPQAATRLDAAPEIGDDEVRIRVERLNLDAASFRQLATKHSGDGAAVRAEVLRIIERRGKMQNPVTGSGGMLIGTVDEVGPESPLGLQVGDRVATLVSLSLTPLQLDDGLARWDGRGAQVPASGHAVLFGRSIAARLPADGGTVVFFSMATSFSAAALGAEGLAADVTMLVGNGYVPGHADYALALLRRDAGVRALFEARLGAEQGR